jgi:hypothetical protein
VFTAAVIRHAAETPRELLQFSRMGNATSNNPLALFIRWQTSILDSRLGLRHQPRYALAVKINPRVCWRFVKANPDAVSSRE